MINSSSLNPRQSIAVFVTIAIMVFCIYCLSSIFDDGYQLLRNRQFGISTFKRLNMSDIYSLSSVFHLPPVYPLPIFPLPTDESNITSKVIWVYWDDVTLEKAPYVVKKAIESWSYHNSPSWTVIRLNRYNLNRYMNTSLIDSKKSMSIQAKSDMIRLSILSKHGGVWVDATMLCFEPLDNWVWKVLHPKGFFMFSRECSWFMIAAKDSYIANTWYEGAVKYWSTRDVVSGNIGGKVNYHWMDGVLIDAKRKNKVLSKHIDEMNYIECRGVCSPHGFFNDSCKYEVNQPLQFDMKKCLDENPPYTMKMTYKKRCNQDGIKASKNYNKSNGHYAIYKSFHRQDQ